MIFRIMKILREQENEQGAAGSTEQSTEGAVKAQPEEPKSINSQAKELPWVQNALKAEAELGKLKASIAEKQAEAEKAKLEAEGNYSAALEMEKKKTEDLKRQYESEKRQWTLERAFSQAGLSDIRAVQIFANDYNSETETVDDFVNRIKSDEQNAIYFGAPNQRVPLGAPPPAGGGVPDTFDPAKAQDWLKSTDQKKRNKAIQYYREQYAKSTQ